MEVEAAALIKRLLGVLAARRLGDLLALTGAEVASYRFTASRVELIKDHFHVVRLERSGVIVALLRT